MYSKYLSNDEVIAVVKNRYTKRNLIETEKVKEILEENNGTNLSIQKIYELYKDRYGPVSFSKVTLYKFIKFNMNYRYITLKGKNKKYFTKKNTNIRKILIRKLIEVIYDDEIIVFLDETTFNQRNKRIKAWRSINDKNDYPEEGIIKRLNLILAVTKNEIIYYEYYTENTNTLVFTNIFEKILIAIKMNMKYNKLLQNNKICFYLDNATYHHGKVLMNFFFLNNLKIIFGAPYSCEYNLCEYIFSYIKNKYSKTSFTCL